MSSPHVMVTGGAGFIGSAVVRHAAGERGWQVTNVDALTYAANLQSLAPVAGKPGYRFIKADICDGAAMRGVLGDAKPDMIMHLAAESHVDRSINGSAAFVQTNIVGTHTLLEAARAYWSTLVGAKKERFRFLHVSTDEVFGTCAPGDAFVETTPYEPRSPYAASKAAADHLVAAWHATYGLPTVITNGSNTYGPYQFPEKLIPLITLNALDGRRLPVYGDGLHERDWLHVDDNARALVQVLEHGRVGESYNIGGRAVRTNLEVVQRICDTLDDYRPSSTPRRLLLEHVADRPGHDRRYAIDPSKIEREIGWQAKEPFESGLRSTVAWYLENEWWWQPLRQRVYAGERLGLVT